MQSKQENLKEQEKNQKSTNLKDKEINLSTYKQQDGNIYSSKNKQQVGIEKGKKKNPVPEDQQTKKYEVEQKGLDKRAFQIFLEENKENEKSLEERRKEREIEKQKQREEKLEQLKNLKKQKNEGKQKEDEDVIYEQENENFTKDKVQDDFRQSIFIKRFTKKSLRKKLKDIRNNPENEKIMQEFMKTTLFNEKAAKLLSKCDFPDDEGIKMIKNISSYYISRYNAIANVQEINDQVRAMKKQEFVKLRRIGEDFAEPIKWQHLPKYVIPAMVNYTLYHQIKNKKDWANVAQKVKFLKRKHRQIEFFISLVKEMVEKRKKEGRPIKKIVDFGGGKGDLAITIGYFFPEIEVTVLDIKIETLTMARYRIRQLGASNMSTVLGDIREYEGDFDMAIGLHACGGLTDIILQKCSQQKEMPAILVCTCCFGKMKYFTDVIQYPKNFDYIPKELYFKISNLAESDSITEITNNLYELDEDIQKIMEQSDFYKQLEINKEICEKELKIQEVNQLPGFAREFINNDRINHFIQQNKDKFHGNDVPYILKIPSKYTLRNQFIVLE
ncbi:hypothetical protein PPERSA_07213 [Pseudocohnilembus persalinus]|uniref:Methyltransferase domain-containing protein n=1 Tax=Pseudocohnilembus persalinus TaxID=266149 RepID=A0A0V0QD24_PSEPJ|nr:hypothetical protein PPERSA_07213 [Pseudocohnilembus persalinus]|eukprot:KRX00106.1 hypothetical protein PPERSA_07213 [Pseudocohnilembus persalinus]